jgi:phosphatidylglycerol---prolipoprotein diacylglyceryl transferase
MFNFLHTFIPNPILISFGPINIYWYGMFIVLGILAALATTMKLAEYYAVKKEDLIDLAFYLIIAGIIGARVYEIFLDFSYYLKSPLDIFKIWNGGLAIHGAVLFGIITLWVYAKKKKINFWLFAALITPGLALAQAIGRWGNYFNQELYGRPTTLPWGIPIEPARRLPDFFSYQYFHPTFLYESLGSLLIFGLLIYLHFLLIKKQRFSYQHIVFIYLIAYSVLRFATETLRIDNTYTVFNLRWPQFISLIIIAGSAVWFIRQGRSPAGLEKK